MSERPDLDAVTERLRQVLELRKSYVRAGCPADHPYRRMITSGSVPGWLRSPTPDRGRDRAERQR